MTLKGRQRPVLSSIGDLMKVVVFPNETGGISILMPVECGLSLDEIARKDVPQGRPYKIIDRSALPSDRTYRDAWTLGEFVPDGIGERQ